MDNKGCIRCHDCEDCRDCEYCARCDWCVDCVRCKDCEDCRDCVNVLNGNGLQDIRFDKPADCKGLTQEQAEAKMKEKANG